jgi:hypothetical protein
MLVRTSNIGIVWIILQQILFFLAPMIALMDISVLFISNFNLRLLLLIAIVINWLIILYKLGDLWVLFMSDDKSDLFKISILLSYSSVMLAMPLLIVDIPIEIKVSIINNISNMALRTIVLIVIGIILFILGMWRSYSIISRNTAITDILSAIIIGITFMLLPITIVAKASRIIAPMGHVNLSFAFLLFPICVVAVTVTLLLSLTRIIRIILGTSLYQKSIKFQERLNFFMYFLLNVILWTIYRILNVHWKNILKGLFFIFFILFFQFSEEWAFIFYCLLGIILPTYFFILNILYMAEHLEYNGHLSPETVSTYDRRLDRLGLSNYRWVIGGDDDFSPSNKPGSSTSGTSSPGSSGTPEANKGSSGAPEGGPKKPDDSWWTRFVKKIKSSPSQIASTASEVLPEAKPKTAGQGILYLLGAWVISEGVKLVSSLYSESVHSSNAFNNASKMEDIHTKNVEKMEDIHTKNVEKLDASRIQAELDKELQVEDRRHNNKLNEDAIKIDKQTKANLDAENLRHDNVLKEDATRIETETKAKKEIIDYKKMIIKPSGNLEGGNSSTASPETPESSITQKETSSIFSQAQKRTFFNDEINKTLFDDEINKGSSSSSSPGPSSTGSSATSDPNNPGSTGEKK